MLATTPILLINFGAAYILPHLMVRFQMIFFFTDAALGCASAAIIGMMSIINLVAHGSVLMLLLNNFGSTYWSGNTFHDFDVHSFNKISSRIFHKS